MPVRPQASVGPAICARSDTYVKRYVQVAVLGSKASQSKGKGEGQILALFPAQTLL